MTSVETQHRGSATIGSAYYPVLVAVFTGLVLISNVAATKGVAFGPLLTDGGFIVFPLTYVIGDVLSEVYGFRAARRAVFVGFAMQALAVLVLWATVHLPAAPDYANQDALATTVASITGLAIAGLSGFLVGQLVNAWVVVRIKERTKEDHLWARLLGSTVVGQFADTLVFCAIAAPIIGFGNMESFAIYAVIGWIYKTLVEAAMLPITYRVIAVIKRREPTYEPAV
ncbi:queuosine precursor transporter [Mycolicibacterium sp. S2-37]|uniref:queuosine precursor transporter n=1 Tax=Mycolicibacterium sp. S2-37 TaxID=2810297 RepID=UPI001A944E2B|nr:queuosine precursor transporter [Mycolicibacterium sp. S2-37]MBO0678404.1 queuosine precursor transporter [Mycolicibacterium sp. S2-37]